MAKRLLPVVLTRMAPKQARDFAPVGSLSVRSRNNPKKLNKITGKEKEHIPCIP